MTTRTPSTDPRSIVTPDAFDVSTHLLGTPLGAPGRRLVALLIDLVVIGLVTLVTKSFALVLGVVAAVFFMRAGFKRTPVRGSVFGRAMRLSVGCLGFFIAIVTASLWWAFGIDFGDRRDGDDTDPGAAAESPGVPGVGRGIAGLLVGATLADVTTVDAARGVAAELVEAGRDLGMDDDDIRETFLDGVPAGAPWSDSAAAVIDVALGRAGLEADPSSPLPADVLAAAADTLRSLQERLAEAEEDLREEAARRRAAQQALEDETSGGLFNTLRDFVDELGFGFGWASLYLTVLLSAWNGQTVGKRLMGLRVVRLDGEPITWWVAFERAGGYAAGFATGLLGFAQVLWDSNRQAIHDRIVGTVVVVDGAEKVIDWEKTL